MSNDPKPQKSPPTIKKGGLPPGWGQPRNPYIQAQRRFTPPGQGAPNQLQTPATIIQAGFLKSNPKPLGAQNATISNIISNSQIKNEAPQPNPPETKVDFNSDMVPSPPPPPISERKYEERSDHNPRDPRDARNYSERSSHHDNHSYHHSDRYSRGDDRYNEYRKPDRYDTRDVQRHLSDNSRPRFDTRFRDIEKAERHSSYDRPYSPNKTSDSGRNSPNDYLTSNASFNQSNPQTPTDSSPNDSKSKNPFSEEKFSKPSQKTSSLNNPNRFVKKKISFAEITSQPSTTQKRSKPQPPSQQQPPPPPTTHPVTPRTLQLALDGYDWVEKFFREQRDESNLHMKVDLSEHNTYVSNTIGEKNIDLYKKTGVFDVFKMAGWSKPEGLTDEFNTYAYEQYFGSSNTQLLSDFIVTDRDDPRFYCHTTLNNKNIPTEEDKWKNLFEELDVPDPRETARMQRTDVEIQLKIQQDKIDQLVDNP